MNTTKKISWHAVAVTAALMTAGVAHADHRDGGYRRDGDEHHRVWRDHEHHYYRHDDRDGGDWRRYGSDRDHWNRRYGYPSMHREYYGRDYYRDHYPGVGWASDDFDGSVTISIPLN